MIEIKHRGTGNTVYTVNADTLVGAELRDVDLRGADLREVDLRWVDLRRAELSGADLSGADLREANLSWATLTSVDLSGADLSGAELNWTHLIGAELVGTNLYRANLSWTELFGVNLSRADLSGATLNSTHFADCTDLHEAVGLHEIHHFGPSNLDARTLRACVPHLPDAFLRGVGYTSDEIENLRAMYRKGIAYYSCFLSYAHLNSEFADRLRTDLLANNVSCWQDTQELRGGDKWADQINVAIRKNDKLLLVCSRQAVYRPQVVREILEAIDAERETGEKKLFPIRLDDHILSPAILEEAREKVKSGEWRENWVYYVQQYQIPDFSKWKEHDAYQAEFQKLLRDLKNPAKR